MSFARSLAWLGLSIPVSACAINPVPVTALPGPNKDFATYQKDETQCRSEAAKAAYAPNQGAGNVNTSWQTFFTAFGKCESARGNLVQPVPWAVAYQNYLGYGMPYPAPYPPAYAYPPPYLYFHP